ncbi:MAG: EthD family reductase [Ignavibacteriae bacterium]|nr:EthD family reductase [Ignavibacteriota bacterium]
MVKLIALYRKPADFEAFDEHYHNVHIPLVKKIPGLRKIELTKITGAPMGEARYHVMAEMYYDSLDAMNAGNASTEGRAAAKDLMSFAADVVTLFYGEVKE